MTPREEIERRLADIEAEPTIGRDVQFCVAGIREILAAHDLVPIMEAYDPLANALLRQTQDQHVSRLETGMQWAEEWNKRIAAQNDKCVDLLTQILDELKRRPL